LIPVTDWTRLFILATVAYRHRPVAQTFRLCQHEPGGSIQYKYNYHFRLIQYFLLVSVSSYMHSKRRVLCPLLASGAQRILRSEPCAVNPGWSSPVRWWLRCAVLDFPGGPLRSGGESSSVCAGVSTPKFMVCVANATVGIFGMGYDALHRQME
jgi:hypothetical protein